MENKYLKAFTVKERDEKGNSVFEEVSEDNERQRAKKLIVKFGDVAADVADTVVSAIKHEDNRMYYEIIFWKRVAEIIRARQAVKT